jgi:hypothetical protein
MKAEDKKAAARAWKERKSEPGLYAIRCAPAALAWVGRASDLGTVRTRIWFALRLGSSPHRALQQAWRDHGEAAFTFETLERIEEEDISPELLALKLRNRLDHWAGALAAQKI